MTDQDLLRAVERFAHPMEMSGMPRMAARVFAYALAEDSDRYTAAQLAQGLQVSPAAISGAVRYLLDARLLFREREPGLRSDLYRVYDDDDVWSTIMAARLPTLDHFVLGIDEAIGLVGEGTSGGRRLAETREFFRFMQREMGDALERWRVARRQLVPADR
jgi:DNA-binding transcriptional regulator GbsR (MarR family)